MVGCQKLLIHLSWKRQISADSAGGGSNLNCSCLIVCSLFFPKIISRYISIYLIRETPKVLQDSTPSYERSCPSFWPHFETGIRNSKKKLKTFALCHYMWPTFQEKQETWTTAIVLKKCSQKRAIMYEDPWLSRQMANVMATFMA